MCENQPLEGTSVINIGRGGGNTKSEAGNCARWVCRSSAVLWVPRSASVLRCTQLTVPTSTDGTAGGGRMAGIYLGWGSICVSQPVTAGDGSDLFTDRAQYVLENFPMTV